MDKKIVEKKMKTEVTKKQARFMKDVFDKNCSHFKRLMANPEFIEETKRIQECWDLPIAMKDSSDVSREPTEQEFVFFHRHLSHRLNTLAKLWPGHSRVNTERVSRLFFLLMRATYQPSENDEENTLHLPGSPLGGSSDLPSAIQVLRFIVACHENEQHILRAHREGVPLPKQVARIPLDLGLAAYDEPMWDKLRKGEPVKEKSPQIWKKIRNLRCTQPELRLASFLMMLIPVEFAPLLEEMRNLLTKFRLGPEWVWSIGVFLMYGINPVNIGYIPCINVGVSNRSSKDRFRLDMGRKTINRDTEIAQSIMQQQALKTAHHNYPDKNLEENLEIINLSKEKPNVRKELRRARKEEKEKLRKLGLPFDPDDDDYLRGIPITTTDAGIADTVFPEKANATDQQLKGRIRQRRRRFNQSQKKRFT